MRLKQFKRVFCLYKSGVSVLLMMGILGGCSSDFSRFTDGITKSSAPSQTMVQNEFSGVYPPAPQKNAYGKVESGDLTPPSVVNIPPESTMPNADNDLATQGAPRQYPVQPPLNKKQDRAEQTDSTRKSIYIVQAGDNLIGIARRHDVTVAAIKRDNDLTGDKILIDQRLTITGGMETTPDDTDKTAETAEMNSVIPTPMPEPAEPPQDVDQTGNNASESSADAAKPAEDMTKPEEKNDKTDKEAIAGATAASAVANSKETADNSAQTGSDTAAAEKDNSVAKDADKDKKTESSAPMIWPVKGNIINSYGQRTGTSTNDGIDIAVPEGTKVQAAESGMVIYAGDGLREFGNTILIRHDDNIVTVYGHNSKLLVHRGQQVGRGEDIALSGSSGNASIAKLHFEVRKNSAPVNPIKYLPSIH